MPFTRHAVSNKSTGERERGVFIKNFTTPTTGNFVAGFGKERLTENAIFFFF